MINSVQYLQLLGFEPIISLIEEILEQNLNHWLFETYPTKPSINK